MRARQEVAEMLGADGQGDGQADGRPDGIAAAHPVPQAEGAVDAELARAFTLEVVATKCRARSRPPRSRNQVLAAMAALDMVSWVVKVLDAMTKSVCSGILSRKMRAMSWPSTLETKSKLRSQPS